MKPSLKQTSGGLRELRPVVIKRDLFKCQGQRQLKGLANDVRLQDDEELQSGIHMLEKELFRKRILDKFIRTPDDRTPPINNEIKLIKKSIAIVKTVQRERLIQQGMSNREYKSWERNRVLAYKATYKPSIQWAGKPKEKVRKDKIRSKVNADEGTYRYDQIGTPILAARDELEGLLDDMDFESFWFTFYYMYFNLYFNLDFTTFKIYEIMDPGILGMSFFGTYLTMEPGRRKQFDILYDNDFFTEKGRQEIYEQLYPDGPGLEAEAALDEQNKAISLAEVQREADEKEARERSLEQ